LDTDLGDVFSIAQVARRPGVGLDLVKRLLPREIAATVVDSELETALADSLYSGYISKQQAAEARVNNHDALKVPKGFEFSSISGLSNEMVERLNRAEPKTFGQIRRIPGLTPAAISTVLVNLSASSRKSKALA
jgi:tRNA uridine 5-carboxymethylaminomethyl modification enzyme